MIVQHSEHGRIELSATAVASLVSYATTRTYGVVGMALPTLASQLAATLTRDPNKGVAVKTNNDGNLIIDVYIIVNYGINIASIAHSLINAIRYYVEEQTEMPVQQVNIHVQGLRMPSAETIP